MDEMDKREAIDRLQRMYRNCDPDSNCLQYRRDTGCDGCNQAVRIAIAALEQGGQDPYWENQAKLQAADTGELRIVIAQKLEEVRADIVNIRHMLLTEDTALDQAILSWKKAQLEKWAIFLEDLLYGGVNRAVGED